MGLGPVGGDSRRGWRSPGAFDRPAGLRVLVPGYAQWSWCQSERAAVFLGSFLAALVVGAWTWGTAAGAAMLVFAFGVHAASAADAIRQGAFPGFGRWVPTVSASVGLGLGCYAPALALATSLAWPGTRAGAPQEGYLVNRWAYGDEGPGPGHWVWFRSPEGRGYGVAQVLAGPGQGFEWSDGRLWVGGEVQPWRPSRTASPPDHLAGVVPDGHVLVAATTGLGGESTAGMVLLPRRQVLGRAWARMYPIWGRRLID